VICYTAIVTVTGRTLDSVRHLKLCELWPSGFICSVLLNISTMNRGKLCSHKNMVNG
jgi:hypothetical protein